MPEQPDKKMWAPIDRSVVTALIDKIVAVQLDLKPLRNPGGAPSSPQQIEMTITAACDLLQSAIDGLRDVMQRLEDLPST